MGLFSFLKNKEEVKGKEVKTPSPTQDTLQTLDLLHQDLTGRTIQEMEQILTLKLLEVKKDIGINLKSQSGESKIKKYIEFYESDEKFNEIRDHFEAEELLLSSNPNYQNSSAFKELVTEYEAKLKEENFSPSTVEYLIRVRKFKTLLLRFETQKEKILNIEEILIMFIKKIAKGGLIVNDFMSQLSLILAEVDQNLKRLEAQIDNSLELDIQAFDRQLNSAKGISQEDADNQKEDLKIKISKVLVINDKIIVQLYQFYATLIQWKKDKNREDINNDKAQKELAILRDLTSSLINLENNRKEDHKHGDKFENKATDEETINNFMAIKQEIMRSIEEKMDKNEFLTLVNKHKVSDSLKEIALTYNHQKNKLNVENEQIQANIQTIKTGDYTSMTFLSSIEEISKTIKDSLEVFENKIRLCLTIDNDYLEMRIEDFRLLGEDNTELLNIIKFKEKIEDELKELIKGNEALLLNTASLNSLLVQWRKSKNLNHEILKSEVDEIKQLMEFIANSAHKVQEKKRQKETKKD